MFSSKCRGGHSWPTDCPPERPSVRTTGTHTCYNQLQKYLRHCTVFWQKWPVHDLLLVIPPPPLIKVASNTRPYSKRGGTTLNGREEGGQYYILQTFDQERFEARKAVFSWECLIIFATSCSYVLWEPTDCTSMLWSVDWQNSPVSPDRIAGWGVDPSRSSSFWRYPLTSYYFSNDRRVIFLNSYEICCVYVTMA